MVNYRMITVAGLLASVNGLPLNINLGAYSPALVVGDGEISFGGGQDVTSLLNALEGAAVTSATANTNNAAANDVTTEKVAQDIQVLAEPAPTKTAEVVAQQSETPVSTPEPTPAATDANTQEKVAQGAGLQGMGKQIEPRLGNEPAKTKRDLAGFDRALTFAEAALTKGPLIQLGTGEGGAGVGIIVDNNSAAGGGAAAERRDETAAPRRRRTKVTRMYIKRGIPAAIQNSPDFKTRSVESLPTILKKSVPALSKREEGSSSEAIDAINLNIAGDEGVTMTFVETADAADDDDEEETK